MLTRSSSNREHVKTLPNELPFTVQSIPMEPLQRLTKALVDAGIASRRGAERLIEEGKVTVNGTLITAPFFRVDPLKDQIQVTRAPLAPKEQKKYYMLHKPPGYICSNRRPGKKRLVMDLFQEEPERLFTVGRLDQATTGLLLVTNDGDFAHRIMHPSFEIVKEYLVKVAQEVTHEHLVEMSQGLAIDHTWVKPLSVTKVRRGTFKICVKEGKKHEVRLFVHNAGLQLLELTRIRIGSLHLGSLEMGRYRPLSIGEKRDLLRTLQSKF